MAVASKRKRWNEGRRLRRLADPDYAKRQDAANTACSKAKSVRDPLHHLVARANRRNRNAGQTCKLAKSDLAVTDRCPVFGVKYVPAPGNHHHPNLRSVDKLQPALWYRKGNAFVISMRANLIKGNATSAELEQITHYVNANMPADLLDGAGI